MITRQEIQEILSNITYLDWNIDLKNDGDRLYLQIRAVSPDVVTGVPAQWTGRKWMLSHHMCRNEIVQTAYKAIRTAVLHELDELFRYRGVAVMNPHVNFDKLAEFLKNTANIDERVNSMTGV